MTEGSKSMDSESVVINDLTAADRGDEDHLGIGCERFVPGGKV
jgi:hypothetical protein